MAKRSGRLVLGGGSTVTATEAPLLVVERSVTPGALAWAETVKVPPAFGALSCTEMCAASSGWIVAPWQRNWVAPSCTQLPKPLSPLTAGFPDGVDEKVMSTTTPVTAGLSTTGSHTLRLSSGSKTQTER